MYRTRLPSSFTSARSTLARSRRAEVARGDLGLEDSTITRPLPPLTPVALPFEPDSPPPRSDLDRSCPLSRSPGGSTYRSRGERSALLFCTDARALRREFGEILERLEERANGFTFDLGLLCDPVGVVKK